MSANNRHPELRDGEVFLRNTSDTESVGSERLGNVAYSRAGTVINGLYPVFCKQGQSTKQQKILGDFGLLVKNMDAEATANSYVECVQALQELNRATDDRSLDRLNRAKANATKLIKGAGFSL